MRKLRTCSNWFHRARSPGRSWRPHNWPPSRQEHQSCPVEALQAAAVLACIGIVLVRIVSVSICIVSVSICIVHVLTCIVRVWVCIAAVSVCIDNTVCVMHHRVRPADWVQVLVAQVQRTSCHFSSGQPSTLERRGPVRRSRTSSSCGSGQRSTPCPLACGT